ncbi:DUF4176 domain-containing protein [Streptococcus panodentis]|uniref:DUF4176 domain-containing protein n=1 Tax=Streptococcus panodentis TaxID=1581472 RepID=A0ABS5B027_9STRE|nr:DUF4176 domain-containing protein [Streptococcus panodentis]MBP2621843.1 hypothetical protein [Streptococcus panodentis]
MSDSRALYQLSLNRLPIEEADREVLKDVGLSLVRQEGAFRELQAVFFKQGTSYLYRSILGSSIELVLDWEEHRATVLYLDREIELQLSDFRSWLAYTDLLLSPVLPLGTIVELNKDLLPEALAASMDEAGIPFLAVILGRRLLVGLEKQEYADYLASLYPYGLRPDVDPIYMPNFFIKQVLQEGYSDAIDEQYVENQYRKDYFSRSIVSEVYHVKGGSV